MGSLILSFLNKELSYSQMVAFGMATIAEILNPLRIAHIGNPSETGTLPEISW